MGIINGIKSKIAKDILIKLIQNTDVKSTAKQIHLWLDTQTDGKDVYAVKLEIAKFLELLKAELLTGEVDGEITS